MKKGYILTVVLLLVMAAAWEFYHQPNRVLPPTEKDMVADNSASSPNTGDQDDSAPSKSAVDKEPAAKLAPKTDNKEAAKPDPKIVKQSPAGTNDKIKQQIPLTAAAAIEQGKANGESMWLLFRSETCAPCVQKKKVFDQLQPEYEGKVCFISIDVDDQENQELCGEWGIQYIPATFILDREGKLSYENVGFFPVEDLKKELDRVVK
ncbi:MAG: thioredoxin family protein [Syntrophomonas sp.]